MALLRAGRPDEALARVRGELARADAALESGFPLAEVVADQHALPLRATEAFGRWTARDPPAGC